jgi:hypothetical protein
MLMNPGATASPFVDNRVRFRRFEIANACDPITSNRDIGLSRLSAGAVVNRPVADDHIKISLAWRRKRLFAKHGEDNRQERTEPKEILFHERLTVANMAIDAKVLKRTSPQSKTFR